MTRTVVFAAYVLLVNSTGAHAQELSIEAPDNWRKEAIQLPPDFAPDMTLRGDELLRFSPGMFNKDSEQFFSYVFIIRAAGDSAFGGELIQKELLKYYRGLSVEVAKVRGIEVDTKSFSLVLKPKQSDLWTQHHYQGKLTWLEPFSTGEKQDLFLEIDVWRDATEKQNYLFVCASPRQPAKNKIWDQLREIRDKTLSSVKMSK